MKTGKVRFNEARALEVLPILASLWKRRDGIFKGERLPEEIWDVEGTAREKALYYFYSAHTMRGGIVSEDPFKWLLSLRERFPSAFQPHKVMSIWNPNRLRVAIQAVTAEIRGAQRRTKTQGVGPLGYKIEELAEHWCHNSKVIGEYWDGDVLNIFNGVSDFEEAFARIDWKRLNGTGIKGMRRKIFSLFTIWLQEQNIVPKFPTPIPVDFHALRVLWALGIIDITTQPLPENPRYPEMLFGFPFVRVSEEIMDTVAIWSQGFLVKNGIPHMHVNPALWTLSRRLCAEHHQNITRNAGRTFVLSEELRKNPGLWPKKYRDPCGICPVESWCTKVAPAAIYYDAGILLPMERVPYHQGLLLGIDWQHHIKPRTRKGRTNGNTT